MKPLIAIVGRPNVGKSTFFNKIAGKRIAIVEDTPGVTRDRLYADGEWCGFEFTLVDTGGIELKSEDVMWSNIRRQAEIAVETSDLILFFLDGKSGLLPDDLNVAEYLRKSKKKVIPVVNKLDNNEIERVFEFYELGLGEPFGISAEQSKGLGDLLDEMANYFKTREEYDQTQEGLKIAVVGKPNAGKSSLVNRLLGFDRVIVSDIAGTTRDAIDTPFEVNGEHYTIIDTAGIRRKRSIDEDVESYSVMRALAAIRRADVVLLVLDASESVSEQDVKIAGYVHEQGKPTVVIMNKWDTIEKDTFTVEKYNKDLAIGLSFMDYYTPLYISAKTGQRVDKVLSEAKRVYENASRKIPTGLLNDVIGDAVSVNEPPTHKGRRLKILYATQMFTNPPSFAIFVNDRELMHFSYKRYLENTLRKSFDFSGTPIKLSIRNKNEDE